MKLGKLEEVDIRELWKHEQYWFFGKLKNFKSPKPARCSFPYQLPKAPVSCRLPRL